MASEVQICNMALLEFGDTTITALTEETKEARACKVLYPILRDQLLYIHPWNFALKRADISAALTDTPDFEWDYAYTLPTDPPCLRVWELYGTTNEWVVENGLFLTNQDEEIYIRYIAQITETGRFNPAFVTCLSKLLAAMLAPKLAGDSGKGMRTAFLQELNTLWLPQAYKLNAMEGKRPRTEGDKRLDEQTFSWQTEGR